MRLPKTCKQCGKEKTMADFAYNMSKDSIKFEDPRNDICQDCQQAKAMTVRNKKDSPISVKLTDGELGIIEMVKQDLTNQGMADKLGVKLSTFRVMKSKANKKLKAEGMTFWSYPKPEVEG